jgi:hypothetical protein
MFQGLITVSIGLFLIHFFATFEESSILLGILVCTEHCMEFINQTATSSVACL